MRKDKTVTVRMNREVKQELEKEGYSMQRIFDKAVEKLVKITTSITLRNKSKGEEDV